MDSYKINKKNPCRFNAVKRIVIKELIKYKNKFIIIKIPVVKEVVYWRTVGYKMRKVKLSKKIKNISTTKICKALND